MHLYGHPSSGNVYKVQLIAGFTGRAYDHIPTDFGPGTRTPAFLRMNPNGKVPVIDDDGFTLWESDAILCYLAEGTPWLPAGPQERAKVLQWLFFEQYSHEPYIATSRAIAHFESDPQRRAARLAEKREGGEHALAVMEQHLAKHEWFVGGGPTIADIALYAYTHVSHEGGFDLAPYPSIRAWCDRFQVLQGYVPIAGFETLTA